MRESYPDHEPENYLIRLILEELPDLTEEQKQKLRNDLLPTHDTSVEAIIAHGKPLLKKLGHTIPWELLEKEVANYTTRKKNTSTSYYVATRHYTTELKDWGGFYPDNGLHIEQITPSKFLWAVDLGGDKCKRGIAHVKKKEGKNGRVEYLYLEIGGREYRFKDKRVMPVLYRVPSLHVCEQYTKGEYNPRPFTDIATDILEHLQTLFEFKQPIERIPLLLHIGQTCIAHVLDTFFYVGVDATKGSGKTTLLEILSLLCRHGFLAADITAAGVPRIVDRFAVNVFVDELDQRINRNAEGDVVAVLRKGQRRGNPYVRCQPPDFNPVAFDVAGAHAYSFRSEVEDACTDRTLLIHAAQARDARLPILNIHKDHILAPLADELFLWSVENSGLVYLAYQKRRRGVATCSGVAGCRGKIRERGVLYEALTRHLSEDEKRLLSELTGRNAELGFVALDVSHLLGLDLGSFIAPLLRERQANSEVSTDFYLAEYEEHLRELLADEKPRVLQDGTNAGCKFFPKNEAYKSFCVKLAGRNVKTIGTKRHTSLLRDLGFMDGVSLVNQRWGNVPTPCLVFVPEILERLKVENSSASDDDLVFMVRDEEKRNGKGYDMNTFSEKFGEERMQSLIQSGGLMENPRGWLKVVE